MYHRKKVLISKRSKRDDGKKSLSLSVAIASFRSELMFRLNSLAKVKL